MTVTLTRASHAYTRNAPAPHNIEIIRFGIMDQCYSNWMHLHVRLWVAFTMRYADEFAPQQFACYFDKVFGGHRSAETFWQPVWRTNRTQYPIRCRAITILVPVCKRIYHCPHFMHTAYRISSFIYYVRWFSCCRAVAVGNKLNVYVRHGDGGLVEYICVCVCVCAQHMWHCGKNSGSKDGPVVGRMVGSVVFSLGRNRSTISTLTYLVLFCVTFMYSEMYSNRYWVWNLCFVCVGFPGS